MRTLIFSNAEIKDYTFIKKYLTPKALIICCDGGLRHAKKLNITPHYILGDFDSVDMNILAEFKEKSQIKQFKAEKDFTDTEAAVLFATENGAKELFIFGGVGSRLDHSLANLQLLTKTLESNTKAYLLDENNLIFLADKDFKIEGKKGELLSLLPLTGYVSGITTKGLLYSLENYKMSLGSTIGISNVFTENIAEVKISTGILIVVKSKDI